MPNLPRKKSVLLYKYSNGFLNLGVKNENCSDSIFSELSISVYVLSDV